MIFRICHRVFELVLRIGSSRSLVSVGVLGYGVRGVSMVDVLAFLIAFKE
jgi:hypothetical protein